MKHIRRYILPMLCLSTLCLALTVCIASCTGNHDQDPADTTDTDASSGTDSATEAPTRTPTEPATDPATEPATEPITDPATQPETEPVTGPLLWSPDVVVWYDIDNGSSCNTRPDNGWYYLYSESPGVTTQNGLYRAATLLLGTYDQRDPEVCRQHLYWLRNAGFTVISVDVTNVKTIQDDSDPGMYYYYKGVYDNVEALLAEARKMTEEGISDVPKIYVNVRLFGEDYDGLKLVLEDYKALYEKYPEQVWHYNGSEKPFIGIFADWSLFDQWKYRPKTDVDDYFDYRWTNGFLKNYGSADGQGGFAIDSRRLLWPFVENEKGSEEGSYVPIYTADADGDPEAMVASVSVWEGWNTDGSHWDAMNNLIDGKTPLDRTLEPVYALKPSVVILDRFNYPLVWLEEYQEGVGLYHSGHFEPCEELGFDMLYAVTRHVYAMRGLTGEKPAPSTAVRSQDGYLIPDLTVMPAEYRIGTDASMEGAEWKMYPVSGRLDYRAFTGVDTLYIQTRNAFGESEVTAVTVEVLNDEAKPFTFEFEAHGDESKYKKEGNAWVRSDDFTDFMPENTSGGASLFCSMHVDNTEDPNSAISTTIFVEVKGTYQVTLGYFMNNTSPVLNLYLDGQALGGQIEMNNNGSLTLCTADLGTVTLTPGNHTLRIESTETHSGRWEIWLDALFFTPVE